MIKTKADYKQALGCLTKARKSIADIDNWTQGTMEFDGRRCAVGAIRWACVGQAYAPPGLRQDSGPYNLALEAVAISNELSISIDGLWSFEEDIISWNDQYEDDRFSGGENHSTHEAVLDGFDRAITYLKEAVDQK